MTTQAERNAAVLSTEHLMVDLGRRTAHGGIIAVSAQPIRMVLQFVTTAIMARLLAPEDFGLVAMAMAVTGFAAIFSNMGLASATIQKSEIDQDTVSGLFFITLGVGLLLVPLASLAAPVAAWFFKDARVTGLIIAMSLTLPMAAAGGQHTALMMRNMRWMSIQWTGLAGHAAGALAGILVAWLTDLGYWSLVVTAWVANIVTTSLIWISCRWRPTLVKDWSGAVGSLNFGLNMTGYSVVNFFHRQLDNIIIGWRSGPGELGLYTRAYQLMMLPITMFNGPLSSAVEPSLSRLQNEPERWRRAFLDALSLTTFLGVGMAAGLIVVAEPLITLLYGPNWTPAAKIFFWLAVSMFSGAPMAATGWIYVSLGRAQQMLIWSLIFTPAVAAAFLIGMSHGAVGIAMAYAVVMNLSLVPCFAFAARNTPVSLRDCLVAILPLVAAGATAAAAGAAVPVQGAPILVRLFLPALTAGGVYLILGGGLIATRPAYEAVRVRIVGMAVSALAKLRRA